MDRLGEFMLWLRYARGPAADAVGGASAGVVVRQPGRINAVLVAVREFLKHAVASGDAPARVLSALYEIGDNRWLPDDLRGERTGLRYVARPRHRLSVPERRSERSSDDDALALLRACRSARDRFIVVLLGRGGLRRGEAAGLRRPDMHMALDSKAVGCDVLGEHLHVVRREDAPNGAVAKSPRSRVVPLDFLVVEAYDDRPARPDRPARRTGSRHDPGRWLRRRPARRVRRPRRGHPAAGPDRRPRPGPAE
jgi:integrase